MRVLVTGTDGFIGKAVSSNLHDCHVFSLELNDFYFKEEWQQVLLGQIQKINPEIVFHIGACSDTLETNVNYMMELNFESSKIISDWCYNNNKKIIYSSSAASYGAFGKSPTNLYGWSKYVSESYVVSKGGVALRYFNVYGPGESHKGRMSSFAHQAYRDHSIDKKIKLFPGNPKRDFIYIEDVVSANLFAMKNFDSLSGDWYDVGTGESNSFEEVLSLLGISKWEYLHDNDIPSGYQFFTRAVKLMKSWKPKFNLQNGIERYKKYLLTKNE